MLREVILGNEALEYIKGELANGSALAANILNGLKLEDGTITTFLPEDVDSSNIIDFTDSVAENYRRMYGDTHDKIANLIFLYLMTDKKKIAIFEDLLPPDAEYLQKESVQYFYHEQDVYVYLTCIDLNEAKIARTITGARGYPFVAALTSLSEYETLPSRQAVSAEFLQKIVKKSSL